MKHCVAPHVRGEAKVHERWHATQLLCLMRAPRAGLAPIAGALCVELLAALLQHPQGVAVKPVGGSAEWDVPKELQTGIQQEQQQQQQRGGSRQHPDVHEGALGGVPHMLRGNLTGFSVTCMEGRAFGQCTACSATIVEQYKRQGCGLVLRAAKVGMLICSHNAARQGQDAGMLFLGMLHLTQHDTACIMCRHTAAHTACCCLHEHGCMFILDFLPRSMSPAAASMCAARAGSCAMSACAYVH